MLSVLVGIFVGLILWIVLSSRIEKLSRELHRVEAQADRDRRTLDELRGRLGIAEPVTAPAPPAAPAPGAGAAAPRRVRRRWKLDTAALLARLPVWLGSAALAMAGLFLVKYGWERDWLGPLARVALAFAFGAILLGAGTALRRTAAGVAQGLVAAGIAVLYAATLAAVELYDLIPAGVGFGLLAAITLTAVLLALSHGPWVAVLGLVGGYLTPTWIGARDPSPVSLFSYLLLLHAGLVAAGRARRWRFLPLASAAAALLWAASWALFGPLGTLDAAVLAAFVAVVAASVVALAEIDPGLHGSVVGRIVAFAAPVVALAVLATVVDRRSFDAAEWALFAAIAAGCVLLARWRPDLDALAWIALAGSTVLLFAWSLDVGLEDEARFVATSAAFGLGFTLAGGLFARSAPTPWFDAARAAVAPSATMAVVYLGVRVVEGIAWGAAGAFAAAVLAALAWDAFAHRERLAGLARTGGVFAVGAACAAALGLALDAPAGWLPAGWAAIALALTVVHAEFGGRSTRIASLTLAGLAALACLAAPALEGWPYGAWRLAAGFGAAIALLALVVRAQETEFGQSLVAACATVAGGTLLAYEIREAFRPDPFPRLLEWSVLTVAGTLYGLGVRRLGERRGVPRLPSVGDAFAFLSLALGTLMVAVPFNPVWTRYEVGDTPFVNRLLAIYGLTCAAAALAAIVWRRAGRRGLASAGGALAVLLAFLLVTLEIRQAFRGSDVLVGKASDGELYGYSVGWIALSLILLALARRSTGRLAGIASAIVMGLAVVKVFLFDTGNLGGLYRVASLLALGLTLLGLAYVYRRWVFAARTDTATRGA